MSMGSLSRSEALESDYTTLSAPTEILILELQSNVTEDGLRRIFDGYGPISRCNIGIDPQRNVRLASIVYERSADAVQACQMNGKYIDDKRIVVQLRSNGSSNVSSTGSNSNNSANNNNKYANNNPNPNPSSNPNNSSPIYKSSGSHPSPVSHPSTTSPHMPLSSSSSSSSTMPTSTTLAQSQQQQPPFGKITSVSNAATTAASLSSSTGINTNVLHAPIVQSPSPYYMQSFIPFTHPHSHPQPQVAPSGGKSSPTSGSSISTTTNSTNSTRMPSSSFSSNSTPTATSPSSTSPSVSPALFEAMGNLSLHSGGSSGGGGGGSGNASRGTSPDQSTSPDESASSMTSSGGRVNTGNQVYASQLQQQLQQQQQQQQQLQQQQQQQQLPLSGDHMKDFGNHPPRGLSPAHMTAAVANQQQPPLLSFNPVTGLVQQTHAPQHSPVLPMYRFTTTPGSSTPPTEAYSHLHMQTPTQMHHQGKHRSISHSSAPGGYYPVMAPYDLVDYSNLTTTGGVHMSPGSATSSSFPTPGSSIAATPVSSLPATPAKQGGARSGGQQQQQQQPQQQQTPTSGGRHAKSLHLMVPATPPVQLIALDHEQQRLSDPNPMGSTDGMGGGMSMTMSAGFGSSSMPALAHASFTSSNNAAALSSSTTPTPASASASASAAMLQQQHQQQQQQLSANQQQQQQVQALQAAAAAAAAQGGQPMVHYTQQALPNIAPNYVMDMHGNVSYVPSYQLRSLPGSSTYFVEPAPIVSPRGGVCLFVFHLPAQMTEHELTVLFQHCGTVLSVKIITDPETRQSKGYGFVNMASQQEAEQAINMLNGTRYRNKYLKVSFKQKKGMAMMGLAMGGSGTPVMMMPNGGMISTPQSGGGGGGGGNLTMSSPPGSARMTSSGNMGSGGSILSPASSVSSLSSPGTYQMSSSSPHLLQFTNSNNINNLAVSPSSSSSMMSPLPSSASSTPSHARFAQRGSDVSTSSLASTPSHAGSTMSGSSSARSSASSVPIIDTKNGPQGLLVSSSDSRSSVSSNVSVGGGGGGGGGNGGVDGAYPAETSN